MMLFSQIVILANGLSSIAALLILLVRPLREYVLGTRAIRDGQKCVLRSLMLNTYYRHNDENIIRQYELENLVLEYKAYKALGGNSFIDRIYEEMNHWKVVT